MVGGFLERWSSTPSYTKGRRDRDWRGALMARYWPRHIEEIEGNGVSLINEPLPPDNVRTLARPRQRSLHAVLCEALINAQALLARLEAGVTVPRDQQREVVRSLYVATRHQVKALAAVLELEGLE